MPIKKIALLLSLAIAVGLFFAFDFGSTSSLHTLKAQRQNIESLPFWQSRHGDPGYFVIVLVTALSLPALLLTSPAARCLAYGEAADHLLRVGNPLRHRFPHLRYLLRDCDEPALRPRWRTVDDGIARARARSICLHCGWYRCFPSS